MENTKLIDLTVDKLIEQHGEKFKLGFDAWLKANWSIYLRFEDEAKKAAYSGRKHYSARTIVEFLRHQTALFEKDGHFKINDHAAPDMARAFAVRNPVHHKLFEFRGDSVRGVVKNNG